MSEPRTGAARKLVTDLSDLDRTGAAPTSTYLGPTGVVRAVLDIEDQIETLTMMAIEDHHPEIGVDISDSTWLECSCGWDSSRAKVGWYEHLEDYVYEGRR